MKSTRDNILDKYLKVCKAAAENDEVFRSFKTHPDYKVVLEHVSPGLGQAHWGNINHTYFLDEDMNLFLMNDIYGRPRRFRYGRFTASPTTIQYISVLSNLIKTFGDLTGFRICEIGGGYAGQAKIIKDKFRVEYDLIDLPECTLLQEKYLKELNRFENVRLFTSENYALAGDNFTVKEYDLFISNYALTEVTPADQIKYVQDICLNSKRGYITANQPLIGLDILKEKFHVTVSPDVGGERKTNCLITWR